MSKEPHHSSPSESKRRLPYSSSSNVSLSAQSYDSASSHDYIEGLQASTLQDFEIIKKLGDGSYS